MQGLPLCQAGWLGVRRHKDGEASRKVRPYTSHGQASLISSEVAGTSLMIWDGSGPTPR